MEGKTMWIEKGCLNDINELECLYNDLNDYLETHINFPGWKKGVYPVKETALKGIEEGNLLVLHFPSVICTLCTFLLPY